jgi:hypothetical protein
MMTVAQNDKISNLTVTLLLQVPRNFEQGLAFLVKSRA